MAFKNRSVDVHRFAMVARADIPRSQFRMQKRVLMTFNSGLLVPLYVQEVLPGDTFRLDLTALVRLATPLKPFMDNLYVETFFFFVPNRLVWDNWKKFMGEQTNPGDSISFTVPVVSVNAGTGSNTIYDYFGIPPQATNALSVNALPFRGYLKIYNEWFRDQNLVNSVPVPTGDGPDGTGNFGLQRRGKRHDYFTSALPFLQKGTAVSLPLGTSAPVNPASSHAVPTFWGTTSNANEGFLKTATSNVVSTQGLNGAVAQASLGWNNPNLVVDLSAATAATVNQLRQSVQIQRLLERDARGGTRYTEIVQAHFGVRSPDARLQRPEYLGGGSTRLNATPVAQTSNTPVSGTPQGNLAAFASTVSSGHGFSQSFTEHGHIIGIVNVRADLTYQQGLRRMWSRSTRYDFHWPVFSHLGEQAVLNKEIYCDGSANDNLVFGYQERGAEYRYDPSEVRGLFRSQVAGTLDVWHLAQRFATLPALNQTFIEENPPISRVIAVPSEPEFIGDFFFDVVAARPMPMYSVPGMMDHF